MSIATRTGDEGTTGLLYGRRVSKTAPRVEAYGTVDELNTAIGMARAHTPFPFVNEELLAAQKNLVALMGELAVAPEDLEKYLATDKYPKMTETMLDDLDKLVSRLEDENIRFDGWATPGATVASAALDVARTTCRRAERLVVGLSETSEINYALTMRYLNRLSDVLWLLARYTETKADTPAKIEGEGAED